MTVIDYLRKIGKYDAARVQYGCVLLCFIVFNIMTGILFIIPLYRYEDYQYLDMKNLISISNKHHAIVGRKQTLESRYTAIKAEINTVADCPWSTSKTTDTLNVGYEQSRACLDAWVNNNSHTISEITFYKNGKTRTLEVVHD